MGDQKNRTVINTFLAGPACTFFTHTHTCSSICILGYVLSLKLSFVLSFVCDDYESGVDRHRSRLVARLYVIEL